MKTEIKPAIFHLKEKIKIDPSTEQEGISGLLSDFAFELVRELEIVGCRLIGHIKGILELGDNNTLFFNTTSFKDKLHIKGKIDYIASEADFFLVVIVYGVKEPDVAAIVVNTFNHFFQKAP